MKVVLFITDNNEYREEIGQCLPEGYFLIENKGKAHGWNLLNNLEQGLVLLDLDWQFADEWLREAVKNKPDLVYIGLGSDKECFARLSEYLYDFVLFPSDTWMLEKILNRAWEKVKMISEGKTESQAYFPQPEQMQLAQGYPSRPWARVLSDFSRALSNQLNKDRFLALFLDAVSELVPVAKLSVLLKSPYSDDYVVVAHRGLDPEVHEQFRFKAKEGIISWLAGEGRILQYSEVLAKKDCRHHADLMQEMKLLHATVCVPLVAYGKLNGVLCIGSKVAGTPFYEKELELLYTVCGNIAIALNDIDLHERLYNQKVYIESILQLMTSGVVAINKEDIITTFNHRAGEILSCEPGDMVDRDLRSLPSPLGDLLYETLSSGRSYHKKEVELPRGKLPLEISTYRMTSSGGDVLGSVMIIDDISTRKQAELERRQAEQIEVLNRFVGQLAHEIKNPMVAIQTFSEMLPEKYDDSCFRDFFSRTVKQELKKLNELIDQLSAFSSALLYKYEIVYARDLCDAAIKLLHEQGIGLYQALETGYCEENPRVVVDQLNVSRAFSYLIKYFFETLHEGGSVTVKTSAESGETAGVVKIIFSAAVKGVNPEDIKGMFDPLEIRPDNTISLGLPVSKKIIEDHGGELQVVQPDSKTLRFEVKLPAATDQIAEKGEKDDHQQV